ncbi:hypothetical protein PGTUg99_026928 [Puccinia graminis f. sp. tritici]|uniref:Uncharacterized protein n=1 Tax=Puccinia graminis f. sp. tritici TaxID=56615 RepID=A0A5B0MY05_PUCGR|nr:hypothetical protein PGTUg99_026928 [Puccinia graminis f. sp. tritici]
MGKRFGVCGDGERPRRKFEYNCHLSAFGACRSATSSPATRSSCIPDGDTQPPSFLVA